MSGVRTVQDLGATEAQEKMKTDLERRFHPEYCPNCGEHAEERNALHVQVVAWGPETENTVGIRWKMQCMHCGAGYDIELRN